MIGQSRWAASMRMFMRMPMRMAIACMACVSCGGSPDTSDGKPDAGRDSSRDTLAQDAPIDSVDPTGPPYPIVLAHGMGGFGTLKGLDITYFNGVKDDLAKHGETSVF